MIEDVLGFILIALGTVLLVFTVILASMGSFGSFVSFISFAGCYVMAALLLTREREPKQRKVNYVVNERFRKGSWR